MNTKRTLKAKFTNILITGLPGVGKTTLIRKLSEELRSFDPVGFYTEEIREGGVRKGFRLASFEGKTGILSHVNVKGRFRVSKYGVDIAGFEKFLDDIEFFNPATNLIIIDEIGKMECFSIKFKSLLDEILESEKLLIATIALKGGGVIEKIKRRGDAALFEITVQNRDSLLPEIIAPLRNRSAS